MKGSFQPWDSVLVEVRWELFGISSTCEERQTLLSRGILYIRGFCDQEVTDWRELGVEVWHSRNWLLFVWA
jgi:hypothetical protein